MLKVNLSVAIVAMVQSSTHSNTTQALTDICPNEETDVASGNEVQEGEFSWDEEIQGHVLASYYYGYVATQLLGGHIAERYGGRWVFGPGVMVTGVLALLTAVVARSSFYGLIVLRVLQGCASGVVIPAMQSMFSKWFHPDERGRFSGFVFSSINFGSLAGMSLSGLLADAGGWPMVFYVFGGMALVWFVPWMLFAYDSPEKHPRISMKERDYIVQGLSQVSAQKKEHLRVPWCQILTSPPVWAGILMQFGSAWVMYTLLSELPTYLKNVLHYDIKQSGVISALPYLFAWVSGSGSGTLSQWIRARGLLSHLATYRLFNGMLAVGIAASLLTITLVGCDSTTIVTMLVLTMFFNSFLYGGSYLNHVDLAFNYAGTISGVLHTVVNMSGIITPLVVGAIINGQQTLTQWRFVFYLSMAVPSATYVFYLLFGSVKEQSWNRWDEQQEKKEQEMEITKDLA